MLTEQRFYDLLIIEFEDWKPFPHDVVDGVLTIYGTEEGDVQFDMTRLHEVEEELKNYNDGDQLDEALELIEMGRGPGGVRAWVFN